MGERWSAVDVPDQAGRVAVVTGANSGIGFEAARALAPPLKAATYATLIGLLSVTGMRVGEAIGLDRDDVDLHDGWLLIRRDA